VRPSVRVALVTGVALCAATAVPSLASTTPAAPLPVRVLTKDTVPAAWLTHPAGVPAPSARWHVGVSVAGRDAAGLTRLLHDQYVKGSPDFHRFLTPAQYAARFGADRATTDAVAGWLTRDGLTVSYRGSDGTYLVAEGTVAQVERTFGTRLGRFTGDKGTLLEGFTANTTAPTVPAAVTAVAGLDTLSVAHRSATPHTAFPLPASTKPKDLWSVYEQPANDTGQGQRLAAFGWGSPGTTATDLRQFESENHLPAMPFDVVQVGAPGTDTTGQDEWDLDSQAATGMAPGAAGMTFYFANAGSSDLLAASIDTWASDPAGAAQASGSYGLCDVLGALGTFDAHEAALTKAAAEGRSFFASTGDTGSGCAVAGAGVNGVTIGPVPSPEYPSTSPHAIGVGGTVLYTTGDPATRDQEIAWTHTGGGQSFTYAAPDYQSGLNPAFTAVGRATADVAAQSGDLLSGYDIVVGGADSTVGGTSLSAPLWQGMWARVSAAAPASGAGFANARIYPLVTDPAAYAASFTDITVGANGLYTALPGYDIPTGWGVPRVTGLVLALDGTTTPTATTSGGGTATGGPTPDPVPALPACPAYPQVTDPEGDATQVVAVDPAQPAASQDDLDLTAAGLAWDGSAQALVATVRVKDLAGSVGTSENLRFDLAYDGVSYELQAQRDATGAATFTWSQPGINAASLGALTGSFDDPTSTITVVLPAAAYAAAQPSHAKLGPGSVLSNPSVLSQRLLGAVTATADSAATASPCSFTVPSPAPTVTPSPTASAPSCPGKGNGKGKGCGKTA
jgi:pseudomonalisin